MKAIDDKVYEILSDDNDLAAIVGTEIYRERSVPQEAAFPRVHYGQVAGTPQYTLKERNHTRVVYQVKGVDSGFSSEAVNSINDRIDALLTLAPDGSVIQLGDGTEVFYSRRRVDVEELEMDGDQRYQHLGGQYEMLIRPSQP